MLEDTTANIPAALIGRDQILLIARLKIALRLQEALPLGRLLYETHNILQTDPKDRVYSLLGMSEVATSGAIVADYSQDHPSLLISTTKYLLMNESDPFHPLHLAGIGYRKDNPGLPSWVVDWTSEAFSKRLWKDAQANPYQSSKGHNGIVRIAGSAILMKGIQFDEVKNCAAPYEWSSDFESMLVQGRVLQQHLVESCALADAHSAEPYPTGQSRLEAFWRCCVGDCNRDPRQRPADQSVGESFKSALRFIHAYKYLESLDSATPNTEAADQAFENLRGLFPEQQLRSTEQVLKAMGEDEAKLSLFFGAASNGIRQRRFANTTKGYYAAIPPLADVGNIICLVSGAQTLFLLRKSDKGVLLLGECYVHGIMDGEVARDGFREMFVVH